MGITLVEPGMRYFIDQTLKQCHVKKENLHYLLFNICSFVGLTMLIGTILLLRYKGQQTPQEIESKKIEERKIILDKINKIQTEKQYENNSLLSGLPLWDNML